MWQGSNEYKNAKYARFDPLLISIGVLGTDQVIAEGAFAVGIAPGGAAKGYSTGYRVNARDTDTAKTDALVACKKSQPSASGVAEDSGARAAKAKCEVVATFRNKCVASALDPKEATPGVGWAIADTQQEANDEAVARCRSTAGPERRAFCKVLLQSCDGNTK